MDTDLCKICSSKEICEHMCPVCYDPLYNEERIIPDTEKLVCGHYVHQLCIQKQFEAKCPLCRCKLNTVTYGSKPDSNLSIVWDDHYDDDNDYVIQQRINYFLQNNLPYYQDDLEEYFSSDLGILKDILLSQYISQLDINEADRILREMNQHITDLKYHEVEDEDDEDLLGSLDYGDSYDIEV
jgi:hypothetical protein